MRNRGVLTIFLAAMIAVVWPAVPIRAQVFEGRELVKADLLAESTAIGPGQPFTVGVRLKMAPGWHTYWQYPGDAGIPTEIKWQLPPGWSAGPIQWPVPARLDEPGDIQIYGYRDEVLLLTEITPSAQSGSASARLGAKVNWLVCEKVCVPGGTSLELAMPPVADAANEEIFAKYRARLPKPGGFRVTAAQAGESLSLKVQGVDPAIPAEQYDFFPLPGAGLVAGHPARVKASSETKDAVAFTIPITSDVKSAGLGGLLVARRMEAGETKTDAWTIPAVTPDTAAAAAANTGGARRPDGSALKFLLFGFLGGFILNLMPCVLPVISLKIFGFIQQAGQSRQRIFRTGLAFAAGIFAWFIGLAFVMIALKAAGREATWAFQFQNPYFVLGMSAVVLIFALNLFGVFEISLPGKASTEVANWTAHEGYAGSFAQGVFATVLATPCTAPFLGTALGFALAQSGFSILLMFLAIAAGMSAPYLLLCAQPAWLRFLPRPGVWMLHVKQFMGFLLLATLLFLLWVVGAQRGPEAVIWTGCFLLALSIACWIKGALVTPASSIVARIVAVLAIVALVAGAGLYFIGGKFRSAHLAASNADLADGWQKFTPARLAAELAQGRAVFLDFTAAWCITCKYNEAAVLETAAVRDAFQRHQIVKMKADWTNADPAITKMLQRFGRPGVPLYVLYPAGQPDGALVLPELLTQGIVLDQLNHADRKPAAP